MVVVGSVAWKKFLEGLRRGDVGPFEQRNTVDGEDCCRIYLDGDRVVACMRACGSSSELHALECRRTFELDEGIQEATSYIYMPSQEEYDSWEERELDDGSFDHTDELFALDPGWAK